MDLRVLGGFVIKEIKFTAEPLLDALAREATAQTRIVGRELRLLIRAGLIEDELSITLYHEVLEAAAVGSMNPRIVCWILTRRPSSKLHARPMHVGAASRRPTSTCCCNSTDFVNNKLMVDRDKIQFDLIKLVNGERILRLTEPQSGLSLEKKLTPADAVIRQKERLLRVFEAALIRAEAMAA